jgi:catechol 2,3-dioxygenase-like lactoylglutathione lyase family enzyme
MITGLSVAICEVTDMDRAVAFYEGVLGGKVGHKSPYWTDVELGGIRLGLHPDFKTLEAKGGWVLCFKVDDLNGFAARLRGAGAWTADGYHDTPSGTLLDFKDPDGNLLQAMQVGVKAKDLAATAVS